MARLVSRIQPCLWFNTQAEEAANFYVGIFPDSRILSVSHYSEAGQEEHGKPPGSLMINCDSQAEIDHYWNALSEGGDPAAQQCGWLADRYGLSWQVTPRDWERLMNAPDSAASQRAMRALMKMKKLDIAALHAAFDGR
jgi:predicted 3-demethylubiquinone-9 3-methyltransferase (glyoxalase superfamily)